MNEIISQLTPVIITVLITCAVIFFTKLNMALKINKKNEQVIKQKSFELLRDVYENKMSMEEATKELEVFTGIRTARSVLTICRMVNTTCFIYAIVYIIIKLIGG